LVEEVEVEFLVRLYRSDSFRERGDLFKLPGVMCGSSSTLFTGLPFQGFPGSNSGTRSASEYAGCWLVPVVPEDDIPDHCESRSIPFKVDSPQESDQPESLCDLERPQVPSICPRDVLREGLECPGSLFLFI
jgi:hypothetical protein